MKEKDHILPMLLVSLLLLTPLTLSFNKEVPSLSTFSSATISNNSATNERITTETIGFEEKSLHEWNLDEVTLDIEVDLNSTIETELETSLGISEDDLNDLIDTIVAIPNNLTESNFHVFVGNFTEYGYYNESIAWIAPSLITDRPLTISRDIYSMLFNISEQEAAQLEVSLPRKSGGIFILPFSPILASTTLESKSTSFSVMSDSITDFVPYYFGDTTQQSFLPTGYMGPEGLSGIPYYYNDATYGAYLLPVPFTNTTYLTDAGEGWEGFFDSYDESNATYEEADDVGTFTAWGWHNDTIDDGYINVSLASLESSYDLTSGILQSYSVDLGLSLWDGYNNNLTASLTFAMSYTGAEEFSFDVQQGDTLGYTFSSVTIEDGLFNALNETSQGTLELPPVSEATMADILENTNFSLDCLGESFQELGLAYNMSVTSTAGDDYLEFIGNPFWPSFPYVLPRWDLQLAYFQTVGHVTHQIIPKLLSSDVLLEDILDMDERWSMDLDADYAILGTKHEGAFEWVTLDMTMDLTLGFNETIPSYVSAFNANMSSDTWITYSGDGLLTEAGISLTLDIAYDSDGDNLTDTSDSFDVEFIFNRVTNEGEPIDAPDPTDPEADWVDITYYKDKTAPTVTFTSPAHDSAVDATSVTATWNGTDNVAIDHYKIRIDGGSWEPIGMQTSYDFTDLAEGMHTVEVYAMDYVENSAVYTLNFYVDVSPPSVDISSPSSGEELEESTVTVEWTGSDNASWIEYYEVRVDEGSWDNVGTDTSHDFSDLSDGDHTVDVRATDGVNRTAMDSISFTVNTSPIGGPGMLEEAAIGVGAVAIIAILVFFLRRKP